MEYSFKRFGLKLINILLFCAKNRYSNYNYKNRYSNYNLTKIQKNVIIMPSLRGGNMININKEEELKLANYLKELMNSSLDSNLSFDKFEEYCNFLK